MTCEDARAFLNKVIMDCTNAEIAAAINHFDNCAECSGEINNLIADDMNVFGIDEVLALDYYIGQRLDQMANDPEITL